jgi:hypothetical protein
VKSRAVRKPRINRTQTGTAGLDLTPVEEATIPDQSQLSGTPGDEQNVLTWTVPASDGGSSIIDYVLRRDGVVVATVLVNEARTYTDTDVENGTEYEYQVTVRNAIGARSSNFVMLTPVDPTPDAPSAPVLSGVAGVEQNSLTWTASTPGDEDIASYRVFRAGMFAPLYDAEPRSYTNSPLVAGTQYTYWVVAVDTNGLQSVASNQVSLTPTAPASTGAPTLPGNTIIGQPTWRNVIWQEWGNFTNQNQAFYDTWQSRGYDSYSISFRTIEQMSFKGSSAAAEGSSAYQVQKRMEPSGNNRGAMAAAEGCELWLGTRFNYEADSRERPPYGANWFNDTTWNSVIAWYRNTAAFIEYCPGFVGIIWDMEYVENGMRADGYTGDTHTAAENRAQCRLRGQQLGQAMYEECPTLKLGWYAAWIPGGWQYLSAGGQIGAIPMEDFMWHDLLGGIFDGMRLAGGNGEFVTSDAYFYRIPGSEGSGVGSGTFAAPYKYDSQGIRGFLSNYWSQTTWNFAAGRHHVAGFNWLGNDNTETYTPAPTIPQWSSMIAGNRLGAEGIHRFEFGFQDQIPAWYLGNVPRYADPAAITAQQSATSQAQVSNAAVPSIGSPSGTASAHTVTGDPSVTLSGSTATITARVAHRYGVEYVSIHRGSTFSAANPTASELGKMRMTWVQNGGSVHTNFDNAYMQCSFATTTGATAGAWYVLGARSIKGDMAWKRVQIAGGTTYVQPGEVGQLTTTGLTVVNSTSNDPAGTTWTSPGYLTVSTNGTYENYWIRGPVYVDATNVTFRHCIIEGAGSQWFIFTMANGGTCTLEDCTIRYGTGSGTNPGASGAGTVHFGAATAYTITRCDISGNADGVHSHPGASGATNITNTYIHNIRKVVGVTHNDGIQHFSGDLNVTGCYIDTGVPVAGADNSCIFMQGSSIDRVIVTDTYLNGGGYQFYAENGTNSLRNVTHGPNKLFGNKQITPPATEIP